jgi:hypothetical protein
MNVRYRVELSQIERTHCDEVLAAHRNRHQIDSNHRATRQRGAEWHQWLSCARCKDQQDGGLRYAFMALVWHRAAFFRP